MHPFICFVLHSISFKKDYTEGKDTIVMFDFYIGLRTKQSMLTKMRLTVIYIHPLRFPQTPEVDKDQHNFFSGQCKLTFLDLLPPPLFKSLASYSP